MRTWLLAVAAMSLGVLPALAQGQRPASPSPYYNVLHDDSTVYRHVVSEHRITPAPGQHYAVWGSGFILGGTGGYHRHGFRCYWVDGHYEYYQRTVWVPGHYEQRYVPPAYQVRWINGQQALILVSEGYYQQYYVPSHYTTVPDSYWVPGYWSCGY